MPGSLEGKRWVSLTKTHKFLTSKETFSPRGIRRTLDQSTKKTEADPVRMRPHPYEFHLYYDI